jgi:hypothetical protein
MTQAPKLKPCPFCGPQKNSEDTPALYSRDMIGVGPLEYSVRCHLCGTEVFGEYEEEIVRIWNRRADLTTHPTVAEAASPITALPDMEWQPIETAPRAFVNILLYENGARRNDDVGEGYFSPKEYYGDDRWRWSEGNRIAKPSKWMPLPKPPKEGDE